MFRLYFQRVGRLGTVYACQHYLDKILCGPKWLTVIGLRESPFVLFRLALARE